jgi:hypothetical protein
MAVIEKEKPRKKSVLRTFRISAELDNALIRNANKKKIGMNALATSIFNKYVEWDCLTEEFGYFTVPSEMVVRMLQSVDKDKISLIAKQVAKRVASSIPIWYGKADLDSLLRYMSTSINYTGARLQHRIEKEGNLIRITVYQPFDDAGIAWAKAFNSALVEGVLGYLPRIVTHADSIETIIESPEGFG